MWLPVFSRPMNTHIFQEISKCAIFFKNLLLCFHFLWNLGKVCNIFKIEIILKT